MNSLIRVIPKMISARTRRDLNLNFIPSQMMTNDDNPQIILRPARPYIFSVLRMESAPEKFIHTDKFRNSTLKIIIRASAIITEKAVSAFPDRLLFFLTRLLQFTHSNMIRIIPSQFPQKYILYCPLVSSCNSE